jgi:hypothetical protein
METNEEKDKQLWKLAQKRAAFRQHLYSYIVINLLLWAIWWFTVGRTSGLDGYPWPIWVMLFWGVGIAMEYFKVYHGDKQTMAEEEYEKLKRKQ